MKILSHRGYWKDPSEKNSLAAFVRSLEFRFGLETDVRDCVGRLVVSHDMPTGREVSLEDVIGMFHDDKLPLAINIKADGLALSLKHALTSFSVENWFAFDMSIPDMRNYLDEGLPVFARASEVEKEPIWVQEVSGIWFDSFDASKYDVRRIAEFLNDGKPVCIVSPELHRWPYEPLWTAIEALSDHPGLMLCTDYPEEARRFFMHA